MRKYKLLDSLLKEHSQSHEEYAHMKELTVMYFEGLRTYLDLPQEVIHVLEEWKRSTSPLTLNSLNAHTKGGTTND
jgi:hypothetical protein